MDVIIEYQFAISFIISLASSAFFIGWQYKVYLKNIAAIDVFKLFFSNNSSLKFEIMAKQLYVASQRVL